MFMPTGRKKKKKGLNFNRELVSLNSLIGCKHKVSCELFWISGDGCGDYFSSWDLYIHHINFHFDSVYRYHKLLAQHFFWDFYLSVALSVRHSMTSGDYDFGIVISVHHNECVHFGMMLKEIVQLLLFMTSSLSACLFWDPGGFASERKRASGMPSTVQPAAFLWIYVRKICLCTLLACMKQKTSCSVRLGACPTVMWTCRQMDLQLLVSRTSA